MKTAEKLYGRSMPILSCLRICENLDFMQILNKFKCRAAKQNIRSKPVLYSTPMKYLTSLSQILFFCEASLTSYFPHSLIKASHFTSQQNTWMSH